MAYTLEISEKAQADLARLDRKILESLRKRLKRLVDNAEDLNHLPLTGKYSGLFKLRFSDKYRVIYDLQREEKRIVIVRVGKRDTIYREDI